MASRRGMNNEDRLALDLANVTATGAVVAAPCYVYAVFATLSDNTTSGKFSLGNSTATTDLLKEVTRIDFKTGTAGASGNTSEQFQVHFKKPVYCQNQLFYALSTGVVGVSVQYLAAS